LLLDNCRGTRLASVSNSSTIASRLRLETTIAGLALKPCFVGLHWSYCSSVTFFTFFEWELAYGWIVLIVEEERLAQRILECWLPFWLRFAELKSIIYSRTSSNQFTNLSQRSDSAKLHFFLFLCAAEWKFGLYRFN
jgi:hypothetical protein